MRVRVCMCVPACVCVSCTCVCVYALRILTGTDEVTTFSIAEVMEYSVTMRLVHLGVHVETRVS